MRVGVSLPGPFWVSVSTRRRRRAKPAGFWRGHGIIWWMMIGWLIWPVYALYRYIYWPVLWLCAALTWVAVCVYKWTILAAVAAVRAD